MRSPSRSLGNPMELFVLLLLWAILLLFGIYSRAESALILFCLLISSTDVSLLISSPVLGALLSINSWDAAFSLFIILTSSSICSFEAVSTWSLFWSLWEFDFSFWMTEDSSTYILILFDESCGACLSSLLSALRSGSVASLLNILKSEVFD